MDRLIDNGIVTHQKKYTAQKVTACGPLIDISMLVSYIGERKYSMHQNCF